MSIILRRQIAELQKQLRDAEKQHRKDVGARLLELRQAKESLDWLEKHTSLEAVILSTQISESGTPPVIPPYLKSRLERGIK